MAVIDVDAHVVESEHTWSYMTGDDAARAPKYFPVPWSDAPALLIDGKIRRRGGGGSVRTAERARELGIPLDRNIVASAGASEMESVGARIADMDVFGVDIQVLQPTVFLQSYSEDPLTQVAMCRSYARWMTEMLKGYEDRLKWAVPLPLLSIPHSLQLMNEARDSGALSVFIRPFEGDKPIYDPYFDPIYAEASRLGMAVGVHVGNGNLPMQEMMLKHTGFGGSFVAFVQPVMSAFHGVVTSGLCKRHPDLRMGFLEASAQWLPWVVAELRRREGWKTLPSNLLEAYRLYVACFTTDDLDYLFRDEAIGVDHIVLGTDYGHADVATEVEAMKNLSKDPRVPRGVAPKILGLNAAAFYGIDVGPAATTPHRQQALA